MGFFLGRSVTTFFRDRPEARRWEQMATKSATAKRDPGKGAGRAVPPRNLFGA